MDTTRPDDSFAQSDSSPLFWPGTPAEGQAFVKSGRRHGNYWAKAPAPTDPDGVRATQRMFNYLVFYRRIADRLRAEEFAIN